MRQTQISQRGIARALFLTILPLQGCAPITKDSAVSASATPRPLLQDEFLEHLVGDWRIARAVRGTTLQNTMQARWVLGHQFVQMHMIDVKRPPAYEAIVLVGYDAPRSRYVAHWCDSFGGAFSCVGFGVRTQNRIEFRFDYPDGPFFNTFTWNADAGTWHFRGENGQPDGSRKLFMEDVATRAR